MSPCRAIDNAVRGGTLRGRGDGNGPMSKIELPKSVMAAINFKGGTGKTTVAFAIAEGICRLMGKRVAVIDCDFQCSASIALLGRRTLNDLIGKNATMDSRSCRASWPRRAARTWRMRGARPVLRQRGGGPHAHSARQPRHAEARAPDRGVVPAARRIFTPPTRMPPSEMAELFRSLLDEFDFVLIDCPPGPDAVLRGRDPRRRRPDHSDAAQRDLLRGHRPLAHRDRAGAHRPIVRRPPGRHGGLQGAAEERRREPSGPCRIDGAAAGPGRAAVPAAEAVPALLQGAGGGDVARQRRRPPQLRHALRPVLRDDRAAGAGIRRPMRRADGAPASR